jgi:hypothetical protein
MIAVTYLNYYQAVIVAHDQVKLAQPAGKIPPHWSKASLLQISESEIFGLIA